MVRITSLLFILFVSIFLSKSAYSLTVYEVIEKIVNNSPELRVIFEKKNQVVENYKDQRSAYLPQVYTIFNREYNKNDPLTSSMDSAWETYNKFQLMLEQRILDVEQMTRILSSAQVVQSQEFENQKLLESLIQLAVISYYDIIQSEYLVSVNKEYLRQVREIESLTMNMRFQGDATLGDVNLVQARLAAANSNLILSQANLDKVRLRLAYLLNLIDKNQIGQSAAILPELTNKDFYDLGDKIINMIPLTSEGLVNEVLTNNIDVLILRSNLCLSGYDLEVQKSRYLPVVNMIGELRSEEDRSGSGFTRYGKLTLEARYSIYDGGSREAGVRKFTSALKELEYQYDILIRDTSDKAFSTFNILRSYEQQRLSILKEIESTEEVDRIYNIQFQFASRSLIDRLDNLERLANSRAKLIQVDYSILNSRLQILLLMGSFVEFFGFQNYLETNSLKLC